VRVEVHCALIGVEGEGAVDAGGNDRRPLRRRDGSVAAGKKKGLSAGPHLSADGEKRRRGKASWAAWAAFVGRVCVLGHERGRGKGGRRPA
jgi:hypothetical protein